MHPYLDASQFFFGVILECCWVQNINCNDAKTHSKSPERDVYKIHLSVTVIMKANQFTCAANISPTFTEQCDQLYHLYEGETERSLGQQAREHDKSLKEGGSKSSLSQHQVKTGHVVISKPVIEGIGVIVNEPRNTHRKVKEAS